MDPGLTIIRDFMANDSDVRLAIARKFADDEAKPNATVEMLVNGFLQRRREFAVTVVFRIQAITQGVRPPDNLLLSEIQPAPDHPIINIENLMEEFRGASEALSVFVSIPNLTVGQSYGFLAF